MLEGVVPGIRAFGRGGESSAAPAARAGEAAWERERADAFALFDEARLLRAYRLAALILRDRDDAEDATQEAIAKAWGSWGTLRDRARFDAWFERILVNVCRNRLRHASVLRMVPLEAVGAPNGGEFGAPAFGDRTEGLDGQARMLDRLALEPAFALLTPDQRIVLVLRFWRDLTVDEIAERLAVPPGTVKSRLHYALRDLRRALEAADREAGMSARSSETAARATGRRGGAA